MPSAIIPSDPLFSTTALTATSLPFVPYDTPQTTWNGLLVVGEAPGADEVRLGRPFVGRSGQLLDKALAQAGIDRAACHVANVFRHQPPGNKIDHFFLSRRAAQTADEGLAEEFGPFGGKYCRKAFAHELAALTAQLTALRPYAILAVGRTPLWALTGLNGITEYAGQELSCRLGGAAPVIATYHPSFILRGNWGLMPDWVAHMRLAVNHCP